MSKLKWFFVFLLAFAFIGYCREFFFVHLNVLIYEKYYQSVSPAPFPAIMEFFRRFSYESLYYSKYFYTLLFILLYFITGFLALKKLTAQPFFTRLFTYAYLLLFLLAGLSMCYGYLAHNRLHDEEYTLSRWLLGIAQSPLICLILVASEKLYNKSFPD